MANERLNIVVSADTKGAQDGLRKVNDALGTLPKSNQAAKNAAFAFNQVLRETPSFAVSAQTGVLALSNNLPILADSFKQAKASGLSTIQTLKVLGKELISFGGILTIAITALTFLPKLFKSSADSADDFNKSIREATLSARQEVVELNALVKIARDEAQSRDRRQNAINELQKKYPDYLRNIDLETIGSQKAAAAIDKLSESIRNKALVEAYAGRIAQKQVELLEKQEKAAKEAKTLIDGSFIQKVIQNIRGGAVVPGGSGISVFKRAEGDVKSLQSEIQALNKLLDDVVGKTLDFTPKEGKEKKKKPGPNFNVKLTPFVDPAELLKVKKKLVELFQRDISGVERKTIIGIVPGVSQDLEKQRLKGLAEMEEKAQKLIGAINSGLTPAFQGFFQALEEGKSAINGFFQGLAQVMKGVIQNLLKTVALAAVLTAITGGKGLVIGGLNRTGFKEIMSGLTGFKFAQGGVVSGPTVGLIGEGIGTSRANPEIVAPLDKLKSYLKDFGGGSTNVSGRLEASGDTLVAVIENAGRRRGRSYGV